MPSHACKQEQRISNLETKTTLADLNITHLVQRLDELTGILKTIAFLMIGIIVSVMGFLVSYWVKGGV